MTISYRITGPEKQDSQFSVQLLNCLGLHFINSGDPPKHLPLCTIHASRLSHGMAAPPNFLFFLLLDVALPDMLRSGVVHICSPSWNDKCTCTISLAILFSGEPRWCTPWFDVVAGEHNLHDYCIAERIRKRKEISHQT